MKNILDKIKSYNTKGLLTLAIIVSVVNNISAQTTDTTDTIHTHRTDVPHIPNVGPGADSTGWESLEKAIQLSDTTTQEEYGKALLTLVQDKILSKKSTNDTTNISALKELKEFFKDISNAMEYFHLDELSPKAVELQHKLEQELLNNPSKLKCYINRGETLRKEEDNY